ncbi:hypothetical protein MJO28_012271 [Puccinia striiformis f. sp. tritici]|uniref:2-(3-amino-3-carboxypropyl)histidine synthase n=3 Tax=Puccinia striiformis TaxID=27350 RepID=A0A2S4W0E0_9BASI|nr:hypothetical protein Pst134EB_023711 [Puccinia striiformis f. sp. tritici]KAI7942244.1 hypothetical protein MJO28_012271 [Puccinia striiformis f. sp. tritici]POW15243.1 hypothetical protein PSTT_02293 [Puccinia striiformis]POW22059.1 hypothetical protein PSHT_01670 [Puccinia striiformis]
MTQQQEIASAPGSNKLADFKILETVEWINQHSFTIIGLQFPDELLPISVPIFRSLRSKLQSEEIELYIMADTTYGSCCVDHVAAQHVNAQAVVHYGQACLSITPSLPVFYVLPILPFSDEMVEHTAKRLVNSLNSMDPTFEEPHQPSQILLMYDVGYHWKSENITNYLKTRFNLPIVRHEIGLVEARSLPTPSGSSLQTIPSKNQCGEQKCCQSSRQDSNPCSDQPIACSTASSTSDPCSQTAGSFVLPPITTSHKTDYSSYRAVFYVGSESARLTHFLVTHPNLPVIAIDPNQTEEDSRDDENDPDQREHNRRTKKLLMRRYATIQRARDADVFGILVGTLGVRHYLEMINRTRKLIEEQFQKKAYVISVGKLKPEKLMNFAEIQAWVLVDCPESSLLTLDGKSGERFDPKLFGAPIITPWELEIALNSCIGSSSSSSTDENDHDQQNVRKRRGWDGRLVLDFERILSVWQAEDSLHPKPRDEYRQEGPVFSMVTGGYKHRKNWNENHDESQDSESKEIQTTADKKLELIQSVKGAASEYALSHRTYFGLEPRFDLDPPSKVEPGRFGIPQAYGDDHPPTGLPSDASGESH